MSGLVKHAAACLAISVLLAGPAAAQALDLSGSSAPPPGQPAAPPAPIQITADGGIEWQQTVQTVTASVNAKAVRGNVTVTADQLIAHYRKKPGAAPAAAAPSSKTADPVDALDQGDTELTELDAVGHVHIYTPTDNAYGDHAVYNVGSAVLVLTGQHLKLTTLHDVVTARDAIEYYSATKVAVARGNALIVADDGRSVAADTLVGYLAPDDAAAPGRTAAADPLDQTGKLKKVDAFGHVVIKTTTDTATGNKGTYLPPTGMARLGGNVHIIHGPNELAGADAIVNMKTGVATLLAAAGGQVAGTIVPNSSTGPSGK